MHNLTWYLSHEILSFELEDQSTYQERVPLWENLVLIKADGAEEAYDKAMQHGLASEGTVTIDGRIGRCRFKGLKELSRIYEEIADGAEIEWREYELSKDAIDQLLLPKDKLHAFQPLPPASDYEKDPSRSA
jgi:hypothetical protein